MSTLSATISNTPGWEPLSATIIDTPFEPATGDYYVRKTGDDSTGDGSTALPWLTVNKALTTIPIGGNKTVVIGDGEYAEDSGSGYLAISRTFTGPVSFVGENRSASKVIIHNASGTSYNTLFQVSTPVYTFRDVTFAMRVKEGTSGAIRIAHTDNGVTFNRCIFSGLTDSAAARIALLVSPAGTANINNLAFTNCTFIMVGSDAGHGADLTPGSGTVDGVTFTNCNSTAVQYGLRVQQGCANINVTGGTWANTGSGAGLIYGADSEAQIGTITGTIDGATISSPASHACLIGSRSGGVVTVTGCTVSGGDYGVVIKENAGTVFTDNTVTGGTVGSLYFKAANGCTATGNTISNTIGGISVQMLQGGTGNKSGTITLTGNTIIAGGASQIYNWGDDDDDAGGCVVNNNTYTPGGSGLYGVVRGDAAVLTLAELRTAWAGYGAGTNDSTSTSTGV